MSVTSGTGRLAVIFFNPSNEGLYQGKSMIRSLSVQCSKCVLPQVMQQQKPVGVGSMYTLDLAELANCMSKELRGLRGLLVAESKSHILFVGGTTYRKGTKAFELRPAASIPSGHIFAYNGFQPLKTSKEANAGIVDYERIPPLFYAVLLAPPTTAN